MKRLSVLLSLCCGLGSCQFDTVKSSCYECQTFSTKAGKQTKTFCDKAEMDRFMADTRNDSTITFMECRNK